MKLRSKIFYIYILFVAAFTLLTLLPAPNVVALTKYHLHPASLRLLSVTILIPTFVMWFAVFYGYAKLHSYSQLIKENHDGKQVAKLANGLLALAVGLPLTSIVSSVIALVAKQHSGFANAATVIANYISITYPLIAFILINKGARGLGERSKTNPGFGTTNVVVAAVITLGAVFCALIAHSQDTLVATYHMSYTLVILTFAIPDMYIWFLGLFGIAEIYAYSKGVTGVVYRNGWNRLAFGLGSIIALEISLQYLETLSSWLNGLSLSEVLLVLYVLLLGLAGGFIVVALGTKELMKIEEA